VAYFLLALLLFMLPGRIKAYQVVVIGDSHSDWHDEPQPGFGYFGVHLGEQLRMHGYDYTLFAASGSSPVWWYGGRTMQTCNGYTQTSELPKIRSYKRGIKTCFYVPHLKEILSTRRPDLLVIEQGTNLFPEKGGYIDKKQIEEMMNQVRSKAKAYLWVGAPRYREDVHPENQQVALWNLIKGRADKNGWYSYDSRFQPSLDPATGKPVFVTPFEYCPRSKSDTEHLCAKAAGKWAEGVSLMIDFIHKIQTIGPNTTSEQKNP